MAAGRDGQEQADSLLMHSITSTAESQIICADHGAILHPWMALHQIL